MRTRTDEGDVAPFGASSTRATDADRFAEWVEPHWRTMHRLAMRLTDAGHADDVLQESLAAAWRKRDQFDPDRGTPQAWLLAIVADQSRKHWARSKPATRKLTDDPPYEQAHELVLDLAEAIRRLSPRQRLAISLYYYLDLAVAEVAAAMQCSAGTVKSTLADARRHLQAMLGDDY